MKFNILIIEDEKLFLDNLKDILKIIRRNTNSNIIFNFIYVSSFEAIEESINHQYYIGCSVDQKILKKNITHESHGIEASKLINKGNVFIYPIMYTNYPFNVGFNSALKINRSNYFNKNEIEIDIWAKHLISNSIKYIENGILDDSIKILPIFVSNKIRVYKDCNNEIEKINALISSFELLLDMFCASVLGNIEDNCKSSERNFDKINKLKHISTNIDSYRFHKLQKIQIKKLLNATLLSSLTELRTFRNDYIHHNKTTLNDKVKYSFINIILHSSYFYTNPIIYIDDTVMHNNQLEVKSTKVLGVSERFNFIQRDNFVNKKSLYQVFNDNTDVLVNLDNVFIRDENQLALTINLKC